VVGALAVVTVHSAPLNAANAARLRGCGASDTRGSLRAPLFDNMQLQQAAQRYSHGASLQGAIAGVGYLAAQSAAIHLSGPTNDAQMESMLVARECRTLQDPRFREFGAEQRGHDIWMVFAAPVSLPAKGDAASVPGDRRRSAYFRSGDWQVGSGGSDGRSCIARP